VTDVSGDEWDHVIRVHLRGHFSLLRAALEAWEPVGERDAGRAGLGVASEGATRVTGATDYSAAKAGVPVLIRTVAGSYRGTEVRVNALLPRGWTRRVETAATDDSDLELESMPPERIGPIVAFLMSDAATDVTGETMVAGGYAVGIYSDPSLERVGYRAGSWSPDDLQARFTDGILGQE
jgi:NAD(P)-dependent dehydrogenase (short-subunit alcohol dehydrogenase family)